MRPVAKGEPLLPALTAEWYNSTLRPKHSPPRDKRGRRRDVDQLVAEFIPSETYPTVARFDPVGLDSPVDTYSEHASRVHFCSVEALTKYNWIVPQLAMDEDTPTQPCVYFGATYAKVLVTNASHRFVDLDTTTKKLVSSNSGRGQILVGGGFVDEVPQTLFINVGNYIPPMSSTGGIRLVQFEMTSTTHADFYELDDTFIENSSNLDVTDIGTGVLDEGWVGIAIYQDGEYHFINARCGQDQDSSS